MICGQGDLNKCRDWLGAFSVLEVFCGPAAKCAAFGQRKIRVVAAKFPSSFVEV